MTQYITYDNIRQFAFVNDKLVVGDIKGVIIDFFGLDITKTYPVAPEESVRFAKKGYLHIVPYYNPWCWMNDSALAFCEKLMEITSNKYGLENTPVVACGASMGGLSALIYSLRAKKTPVACVTNCPVCDLPYHYVENPDMPRTIYSAFFNGDDMDEKIKRSSPMHNIAAMPDIKYTFLHCVDDDDVHIEAHTDKLVEKLKKLNRCVEYIRVPDAGHCGLNAHYLEIYYSKIEEGFATK